MDARAKFMVVNAEAASASDGHTKQVALRTLEIAEREGVDLIFWCEIGDVDLEKLSRAEYDTKQFGRPGMDDPEAGCALSWDELPGKVTNIQRIVGSPATSEGKSVTGSGIRERSIVRGIFNFFNWSAPVNALHAPPSRAARARLAYMKKVLSLSGFAAGDTNFAFNALMRFIARRGRKIVSVGVLAIFVPRRFWVSRPMRFNVGSDHEAFIVTVEPKKARKARQKRNRA